MQALEARRSDISLTVRYSHPLDEQKLAAVAQLAWWKGQETVARPEAGGWSQFGHNRVLGQNGGVLNPLILKRVPVAQLDRALDSGSKGRQFDSGQARSS